MGRNSPNPPKGAIGTAIRKLRKDRGWRLHDLAAAAGLTTGALSKIERGISHPERSSIEAIERVFDVHLIPHISEVESRHRDDSLDRFLASPMAGALRLAANEIEELRKCVWFGPDHEPDEDAWMDFVRLWRRTRRKS